jgi:hypothetical protein
MRRPSLNPHAALAAGLIGLFLLAVFSESRIHSVAADEPPHIAAGLSYFVTHEIFRADPQHPPLLKELSGLSMMAAGIRWPHTAEADYLVNGDDPVKVFHIDWEVGNQLIRLNGPDRILFWSRLPMFLIAGLLAVLLYLWARELVGGLAALAAVFLLVTDPTILAHSQFVTTDIGVAAFTILALFALWRYVQSPGWKRLILCGLCLGIALAAKYSAVLLLPVFAILLAVAVVKRPGSETKAGKEAFFAGRKGQCSCGSGKQYRNCHGSVRTTEAGTRFGSNIARAAGAFGVVFLVAFIVVHITFFLPGDLLIYMKCARMVNADHQPDYLAYMAGELRARFSSYFAVAYLLKEPIATMLLSALGIVVLVANKSIPRLNKLFILLPPAIFFGTTTALADNVGVRYLIPVLPFLHLAGGLGVAALLRAPARFKWAPWAAAVLCGWALVAAAGSYPDHLSYFNEAACLDHPDRLGIGGGSRCGPEWLDDSNVDWGQGFKQLKTWLDGHAAGRQVKLSFTTPFPPEAYGIDYRRVEPSDLTREPEPGLYAISAHLVARIPASGGSDWLRRVRPAAIIGHAIYIYNIPPR